AVLACIAAWGLRALLDPLLGAQITYAPLLLSVAFAAWYGGLGPAVFATLLGAAISWYGYLSPRERTRTELAAERDRFQITLQSIADAVIATDAQGNVAFANDCAAALTGWSAAAATVKPLARIFRTLDEQTRKTTGVALEGGQEDATAGMMLIARDG